MRRVSIVGERGSSVNNAFALALAMVSAFDEDAINKALESVNQYPPEPLKCVYCDAPAMDADHLNGLVKATKYTGHGQVIGNLVPCCKDCNSRKGNMAWREWAEAENLSQRRIDQIAAYESLAPPAVSEDDLTEFYPDLMEAYERLRTLCKDTMRAADNLANEIQRLEAKRLKGQGFGEIADPNET